MDIDAKELRYLIHKVNVSDSYAKRIEVLSKGQQKANMFGIYRKDTDDEILILSADSELEANEWIDVINSLS